MQIIRSFRWEFRVVATARSFAYVEVTFVNAINGQVPRGSRRRATDSVGRSRTEDDLVGDDQRDRHAEASTGLRWLTTSLTPGDRP